MFTVYVYALDTLADWELGYVIAELNSGRFFKRAGGVSQNSQHFKRTSQNNGWVNHYSRLCHQRYCSKCGKRIAVTGSKYLA